MPRVLPRIALVALALCAAGPAPATPAPEDHVRWQAMARADLDAVRARILEAHPGVIDPHNPGFSTWVEQGYAQAKALLPHVVSYDTALAAVRYYTVGFEDGHLVVSDDIRKDFPILVTGWNVGWQDGHYTVVASLPDWSVPLPPVGATWTGCNGRPAEAVIQDTVAPFSDRRTGVALRDFHARRLWMRRPVAQDLRECTFRTPSGDTLRLDVAYQPVGNDQFFDALRAQKASGAQGAANAFEVQEGVLWVRAGNFNLRADSSDKDELDRMLAGLAQVNDIRAIVFDARGNGGGDSGIGDRIFEAATGGLEFDQAGLDALPRYYAQWRVSEYLITWLDSHIAEVTRLYGADSPRVADDVAFRDEVRAALAAGTPWVEQDAGRTITHNDVIARQGRLRRAAGAKVALLTDGRCASACLDFADVVLQVPGVVHMGQATGADSVYMVGSRSVLPSGNGLMMPVKVWRNRTRGNNEAHVPDVTIDLARDEAEIRREVLRALGMG